MHAADLHHTVTSWFAEHARDLPWRRPGTTPWGVLVSEVMSQQTPVARVAPVWGDWLARWPTPAALAAATAGDVLRAWQRLGYPRRALRLRECAAEICARFDGVVPTDVDELRSLPGIGAYTAGAVASFAYGRRAVVLDTNVRRVLERVVGGRALPAPHLSRAEEARAQSLLPSDPALSARWNAAAMELGALVCTARSPLCGQCPLRGHCRWRAEGYPPDQHAHRRRTQPWAGTDRQARGTVMAHLRELPAGTGLHRDTLLAALTATAADPDQPQRVLRSLEADGLVVRTGDGDGEQYRLPG